MCTFENNLLASEFSFLAARIWCTSKRGPLYYTQKSSSDSLAIGWATLSCLRSIRSFSSLTNANVGSVTSEQSIDSRTANLSMNSLLLHLVAYPRQLWKLLATFFPFFSSPRWVLHPKETEKALPEIHVKPVLENSLLMQRVLFPMPMLWKLHTKSSR